MKTCRNNKVNYLLGNEELKFDKGGWYIVTAHLTAADLPDVLPIFPLTGAIVLPQGSLPLNIFEPQYVQMIQDALKTDHKLIGMIQPSSYGAQDLMKVGCAGKIVSHHEYSSGRYGIVLSGLCRFAVQQETAVDSSSTLYRCVTPDWSPFLIDLEAATLSRRTCKKTLLDTLEIYSDTLELTVEIDEIETINEEVLINMLAGCLPFSKTEKQALIEAKTLDDRVKAMINLMNFTISCDGCSEGPVQ